MDRRDFIRTSLGSSAALALRVPLGPASAPKNVLVLGGTVFLGPAIVEAAGIAGHQVTLFNRGITNPELFPRVEKLRGFRSATASEEAWTAIGNRRWDAVIDVWPNDPALAESAARLLRDRTAHYLYVSSIAAYEEHGFVASGLTEEAPLVPWNSTVRPYNRGKAESERRLHTLLGERLTIVRPGAIKGARDDTPDLLAWLHRARDGGRHIGPGSGEDRVQLVDVKDVARFLVWAIDRSLYGTFNLVSEPMRFRDFLGRCTAAVRSSAEFVWIPAEFLHAEGLDPDRAIYPPEKFPFWHPEPALRGFYQISNRKAVAAGWLERPFTESALDYLWSMDSLDPATFRWTDPLTPEIEQRVLRRWAERK